MQTSQRATKLNKEINEQVYNAYKVLFQKADVKSLSNFLLIKCSYSSLSHSLTYHLPGGICWEENKSAAGDCPLWMIRSEVLMLCLLLKPLSHARKETSHEEIHPARSEASLELNLACKVVVSLTGYHSNTNNLPFLLHSFHPTTLGNLGLHLWVHFSVSVASINYECVSSYIWGPHHSRPELKFKIYLLMSSILWGSNSHLRKEFLLSIKKLIAPKFFKISGSSASKHQDSPLRR